jgi:hypothetical protein
MEAANSAAIAVITPELERIIASIADMVVRKMRTADKSEAAKDLQQSLRLCALELHKNFRGENGADFKSYAFHALRLHAWSAGCRLLAPVHIARNKQKAMWTANRDMIAAPRVESTFRESAASVGSAEHMDTMESRNGENAEESAAQREIVEHVERVAARFPEPRAVLRVLFDDAKLGEVARERGMPAGELRKCVGMVRSVLREDPMLRQLYARA